MNTERTYIELGKALELLKNGEYKALESTIESLYLAAGDELAKKKPSGNVYTAMKKVIKRAQIGSSALRGAWIDDSGRQVVCDSYCVIRSTERFGGLETAQGVDVSKFMVTDLRSRELLNLPTVADLKMHVTKRKAEAKEKKQKKADLSYDLGEGLPLVDAELLLIMLEAFPSGECYYAPKMLSATLYFKADNGDGVMCPLRKTNK